MIFLVLFFIVFAYLLGSISTAIIVCQLLNLPDPRSTGSKNPGATNVMRVGGKYAAATVLIGDFIKGYLPVLLAKFIGISGFGLGLVALAAVIGHIYPLFYNFEGGKGVATFYGALFAISASLGLFAAFIWIIIVLFTRYISFASLVSIIVAVLFCGFFTSKYGLLIPLAVAAALIVMRHKENITRLREGTESKINLK